MTQKKQRPRQKHVPQRTCVGCRTTRPKRELVRIVRTQDGDVVIDETGKARGRGAYLCRRPRCWDAALKRGGLNRALRTSLQPETVERLRAHAEHFRDGEPLDTEA